MTKPRKSDPDIVDRARRIVAEQEDRRRQVQAGVEPRRRGHRSSTADDTPDGNPEHTEE